MRDYNGERSAFALRSFALSLLPDKVRQRLALCCLLSLCSCGPCDSVVMHKDVRLPHMCARHTGTSIPGARMLRAHTFSQSSRLGFRQFQGLACLLTPPCLQVAVLAKKGDLGTFLSRCSGKGGASSGACAVLVTDKAATPSVFKALAAEFEGRLGFAAARKGALELVSELGLTK